jgi:hypothetical protein
MSSTVHLRTLWIGYETRKMTSKPRIWTTIWFPAVWGLSSLLILIGGAATTGSFIGLMPKWNDWLPSTILSIASEAGLAGLFVFQVYLFNLGSRVLMNKGARLSMQVHAFAILYGFIGASLVLRTLQKHSVNPVPLERIENLLGGTSLVLWLVLMIIHRIRQSKPTNA